MDDFGGPTVADVPEDSQYARVAHKHWLGKKVSRVIPDVLKQELWDPLEKENFATSSLLALDNLQLLEGYLWPGFTEDSSNYHVLLLALIVNIKRRENIRTWSLFAERPSDFSALFRRILSLALDINLSARIRTYVLVAIIGAFQDLDSGLIRKECAPLVSISIWHNLHSDTSRGRLLEKNAQFKKAWRAATKRYEAADDQTKTRLRFERSWLYTLVLDFTNILYTPSRQSSDSLVYCERFMEFLTDLQSQFPTRRYVNTLLQDLNLLALIKQAPLYHDEESGLLRDFFILLRHFTLFPIDDHTGRQLSREESSTAHRAKLASLQRTALKYYKDKLTLLALSSYGSLEQRDELRIHLQPLSDDELDDLAGHLDFRTAYPSSTGLTKSRSFVLELLLFAHEKQPTFQEVIKEMSLLPTEQSLYEASFLRNEAYNGSRPLAIPKLNLQYLTTGDFLWRSFILFRAESFYEVRKDLEDTLKRMQPRKDFSTGAVRFTGSSRMALPIPRPAIIEVVAPKVGEEVPAQVRVEITLDVSRLNENVRREWETLRPGDAVFLLSVEAQDSSRMLINGRSDATDAETAPFKHLRSAEILQILDENGRHLRNQTNQSNGYHSRPRQRRLIVGLDARAYQKDTTNVRKGKADIYETINLIVRRRSRENNFKSILESIQRLTLSNVPMPAWLQDVFLGLGDPAGATYKRLPNALQKVDYRDTFLDWQHLCQSLPGKTLRANDGAASSLDPPYILEDVKASAVSEHVPSRKRRRQGDEAVDLVADGIQQPEGVASRLGGEKASTVTAASKKRRRNDTDDVHIGEAVNVSTYKPPNNGPYPTDEPKVNAVRFTPAQVEAITSGTQPGLTIVLGPPGTGKTDIATQIVNNIYHNFPAERTLLIAHSNQALNQLFQKIVALDIDERHLLRLGHGEGELHLESEASYSNYGRVESFLENGARLLGEVNRLAQSFSAPGAHGNSCETADYFNSVYVRPAWQQFQDSSQTPDASVDQIVEAFPFLGYFSSAPQPLFPPSANKEEVLEIVTGCYRHIEKIFSQLEDIRPFEVLRNAREKANYLLVKEARIIAMTATHAAMRRQEIADLGFQYDNVIMEEAAQVTEIENFIPLALQNPKDGNMALKRVVLCGDHLQNSPIVQNLAFRQYANLEQSLFLRLVRLGVPTIMLDRQGRARPSLAELYKWRYPALGNLPVVERDAEFQRANAGLRHDYQFINVPDYKGKGEMEPSPHFIQNLGEAEYAAALFMFLRLLGYPASKISILTTYAGQRALIKDVLNHRCAKNRLFGLPKIVTTVDKYQGEQNDYVILSLTRTSRVGYLRDIRRLTVALSRARFGLYILGRREVFESCYELREAFELLFQRPDKLKLVVGEMFPATRLNVDEVESVSMEGVEHLGQYVFEMTQAKIASLKAGTETLPPVEETIVVDDDEEPEGMAMENVEDDDEDDEGLEEQLKAEVEADVEVA